MKAQLTLLNLSLRSIAPREHRDLGKKAETRVGTAIPVHGRRWSTHRDLDSFRAGVSELSSLWAKLFTPNLKNGDYVTPLGHNHDALSGFEEMVIIILFWSYDDVTDSVSKWFAVLQVVCPTFSLIFIICASSKRTQKWRSQRNCQTIFLRGVSEEGVLEGRPPPLFYETPLSAMDLHQMASPCQRVVNCSERYLNSRDGKRMDTARPSASCAAERGKSSLRPHPSIVKVWFSAECQQKAEGVGQHGSRMRWSTMNMDCSMFIVNCETVDAL
ncbi:hypothetical protein CDAR_39991 [Caerostris darwini]|uniref:Uncharacterized protein n=1 Tax=Caerostris darwini TaxID=1538125 RepID=A0AAV4RAT4_9ARAC|nr:hypothetical protein CDAR_39991 [Caerostris darwini]